MRISTKLDQLHVQAKHNRWMRIFTVCCRIGLAIGFLPSGMVKIMGERFTSLANNHPMGHYLEALHHTGYYYNFIGILQVTAALLLLIPRTALLGALLYFPIILNICILSFAVRFDGSLLTSPLMVLANFYLLCWDYDRLKFILPFPRPVSPGETTQPTALSNKFPVRFAALVLSAIIVVVLVIRFAFDLKPRNTIKDCLTQCEGSDNPKACIDFCDCIHQQGHSLDSCLDAYHKAVKNSKHSK
jgi:uncharacterized membrane protein YphA (DoxX/SURF4 family)